MRKPAKLSATLGENREPYRFPKVANANIIYRIIHFKGFSTQKKQLLKINPWKNTNKTTKNTKKNITPQKIAQQQSVKTVSRITDLLLEFSFNLQLLGSERYVNSKLESLSPVQTSTLKKSFIKNKYPRFKREFAACRHMPYGRTSEYIASVKEADLQKMTKRVKLVGILLQTKIYLFWIK